MRVQRVGRSFVAVVIASYVVALLAWRAAALTFLYELWWPIPLAEVFAAWVYLPAVVLLGMALAVRSRMGVAVLMAPLLLFSVEYGRQFLPNWPVVAAEGSTPGTMTVVSWNMLYSRDREGEFWEMVEAVQPDVIALQEAGVGLQRVWADTLGVEMPYQEFYHSGATSSLAILSRHPIVDIESKMGWDECKCQIVRLEWEGRTVTVINVHVWGPTFDLDLSDGLPEIQGFDVFHQNAVFDRLIAEILAVDGPLIVMGDFNTTEGQRNFRRVRTYLEDTFAAAGWGFGFTWPNPETLRNISPLPVIRIDHVFVNESWRSYRAWNGRIAGSDHLFVAAELFYRE